MPKISYDQLLQCKATLEFSVHPTTPNETVVRVVLDIMNAGHFRDPFMDCEEPFSTQKGRWWQVDHTKGIFLLCHPTKDHVFMLKICSAYDNMPLFSARTEDNPEPDEEKYKDALREVLEMELSIPCIDMY